MRALTEPGGSMRIQLNGEPREVPGGLDLLGLLAHLGLAPEAVVVEHNRAIIRKAGLAAVRLAPGDTVEIVHFVGGG